MDRKIERLHMRNGLTFDDLRAANLQRLPEFRNKHGDLAHARPDGSDWCPAQWFQAFIGEVGEFAALRVAFEAGEISWPTYREKARKELADIVTYLDLLSARAMDEVLPDQRPIPAQKLMKLMAALGEWANERKKYERGDLDMETYSPLASTMIVQATVRLTGLRTEVHDERRFLTVNPHPEGVDLGAETVKKFNEVSERVGSGVRLIPE
jgi:hypothetical protein